MATWPGTLPTFQDILAESYQASMPDNVIITDMEVGPPKARRRGTAAIEPFSGTLRMTSAQLATFKTFYESTIFYGALKFDATHPETSAAVSMIFMGQPQKAPAGPDWLLSFSVGILP
jgi:hypothetical protein